MKKMIMVMTLMVMILTAGMPVMAKEAEVPATEEVKAYTFTDIVEEIEWYDIEEEEIEKISSVDKHVDYAAESYTLVVTYSEPNEDGFNWISVIVENGMVEVQGRGPGRMVAAEYTYQQFMKD